MKNLPSVQLTPIGKTGLLIKRNYLAFPKNENGSKFLSIDLESWSELSGSLMALGSQKVGSRNPSPKCN